MLFQDMLIPFTFAMIVMFIVLILVCCGIGAIITYHNGIRQRAKERELQQRQIALDNMYDHLNNMYTHLENMQQ